MKHILPIEEAAMLRDSTKKQMMKLEKQSGKSGSSKKAKFEKNIANMMNISSAIKGDVDTYDPANESLLRDSTKRQMVELNRTIKKEGGDIQDKIRKDEIKKEDKMPNAFYMDNPFDSDRSSIETQEHFMKNGAHYKTTAMKSKEKYKKEIEKMNKNNKTNEDLEISYDMKNESADEDKYLTSKQKKLPEGLKKGIINKMKKAGKTLDSKKNDKECEDKKNKESKEDKKEVKKSGSDEEKYLTPKQRKLPEGLKKGIIAKNKKKKINESFESEFEEGDYITSVYIDGEDNDGKLYKIEKGDTITIKLYINKARIYVVEYNDEEYYLSKEDVDNLGLESIDDNSVINKNKRNVSVQPMDDLKANFRSWEEQENIENSEDEAEELTRILQNRHPDYDDDELRKMAYEWCGVNINEEYNYNNVNEAKKSKKELDTCCKQKLHNLKHFYEFIPTDGKSIRKSFTTDDTWIKGNEDDFNRPMFVNLPDKTIREPYDILRAGKWIDVFGTQGMIIGIKHDMVWIDVMNDKTNKHEIVKYNLPDVLAEMDIKTDKEDKPKKNKKK